MSWKDTKANLRSLDEKDKRELEVIGKLVDRRLELGLTQRELAEHAGLSQSTIARMETRLVVPSFETLMKLTVALELDWELTPHQDKLVTS